MNRGLRGVAALVVALPLLLTMPAFAQDEAPGEAEPVSLLPGQSELRINEFMAQNNRAYADPTTLYSYPDWVELFNPTDAPVSLDGLALTDRAREPGRAPFMPGRFIAPRGVYLFYLDDAPERGPEHLDLGLSVNGEYIGLYHVASGTMIDEYEFGPQEADISWGRVPDGSGEFRRLDSPTPHALNAPELLEPPVAEVDASAPVMEPADESEQAAPAVTAPAEGTVTAFALRVRSGPGLEYARLTAVPGGTVLGIYGADTPCAWLNVVTPAGEQGWVSAAWVTLDVSCEQLPLIEVMAAEDAGASSAQ